jgi:hypothetical protein
MAYLDNTVITVDAVLTKLGRERLSQGGDFFKITKWAVSDDEVDYSLYNTAHPLGTDYYANIIESMPVLEAIPDETQALRYKLYNGNYNGDLPKLSVNNKDSFIDNNLGTTYLKADGGVENQLSIDEITTENIGDETEDYTVILFDETAATLTDRNDNPYTNKLNVVETATNVNTGQSSTRIIDGALSLARNVSGTLVVQLNGDRRSIKIMPKDVRSSITTKIRITGNETGVTRTYSFTVNPKSNT